MFDISHRTDDHLSQNSAALCSQKVLHNPKKCLVCAHVTKYIAIDTESI